MNQRPIRNIHRKATPQQFISTSETHSNLKLQPQTNDNLDESSEILINKVHFIWLGSSLNQTRAKNIPKWIIANDGCNFDFFIWYDSALISKAEEQETVDYVNSWAHPNIFLCDIRKYPIMDIALDNNFVRSIEAYNYESGLWSRAKINPVAHSIKNWGFASDVLRMLILYLCDGFYIDTDMEPIRLCEYFADKKIKSCPIRFCMTGIQKPPTTVVDYDNGEKIGVATTNNNALYYDAVFDLDYSRMKEYFKIVAQRYDWLKDDYYHYLLMNFVWGTLFSSGPDVVDIILEIATYKSRYNIVYNNQSDHILRLFREDPLVARISWTVKKENYHALSILLIDLFSDKDALMRCYYKVTFGKKYYDLTLHESIWFTKILDLLLPLNINNYTKYSGEDMSILGQRFFAQLPFDIRVYLSEDTMNRLIIDAILLTRSYNRTDIYPSPETLFNNIVNSMLVGCFWGGNLKFTRDPIMITIMNILKGLGDKLETPETIDPKFFEELLLIISEISEIHLAGPNHMEQIKYNMCYDEIETLVQSYK